MFSHGGYLLVAPRNGLACSPISPYGHPAADAAPLGFATAPQQILSTLYALVRSTATPAELRARLQQLVDFGALEVTIGDVAPLAAQRLEVLAPDRGGGWLAL
jgi:hypothetical protein